MNSVWIIPIFFYYFNPCNVNKNQNGIIPWNIEITIFPLPKGQPIAFEIKQTQDFQIFSFKTIRAFNNLMYWCSETSMMDMIYWESINKKYISIYVDGGNEMRWMFFFKLFFIRNVFNEPRQWRRKSGSWLCWMIC